jgi:hypothetical protein
MGQSSQAGFVAFRTQSAPNTFPADFATQAIAMKLRSGSLAPARELITPDPEIGGGRDIVDTYLGPVAYQGDYEYYVRFNAMMTLLQAVLGTHLVKTPGGTDRTQTITGGTITGGTYTLTYNAQTTAAIPAAAPPGQVQAALEAISSILTGNVDVTGPDTGFVGTGAVMTIRTRGAQTGVGFAFTTGVGSLTGGAPTLTPATTIAGTDYVGASSHLFLPSDAAQLPFLGVQERIGASLETYQYTDAVLNTMHLETDAKGYLMGTCGAIARLQTAGASVINPLGFFDNLPMVVGTNITLSYNAVTVAAKFWSMDINNNFESDDFRLGSFFLGDLTPKRREMEFGIKIREQDSSLWRQATNGLSAATTPGGVVTRAPLVITMSTYETIPGSTPTLSYSLKITVPKAVLAPYAYQPSGDDIIDSDIVIKAVRPDSWRPLAEFVVTTPKATVQ